MTTDLSATTLEAMIDTDFANAVEALDARVAENGAKIAVRVGDTGEHLTYAELGSRTDALAGSLREMGVESGDRVAVISESPLTSLLGMYGAWKAGAVFAPINPEYSGEYLTYHLNDCGARIVIASPQVSARIEEIRRTVIEHLLVVVDAPDDNEEVRGARYLSDALSRGTRPEQRIAFDQPASIIYTSGTTGPAKGVVQAHRWINQYTWQYRRWLNTDDVVHVDLPMYHVGAAFFNVVRALWAGATVSLWSRFSASQYWDRINGAGATTALLLDVMIPWLMQQPVRADDRENTLRWAHMQPLPPTHREFAQRFGVDFVTAGFGQTEGGSSLYGLIDEFPDDDGGMPEHLHRGLSKTMMLERAVECGALVVDGRTLTRRGFMGHPNPFLEVEVHDESGRICPVDEVGELVMRPRIASVLFSMYLGKPDYSLHAFRDLWFHTGDLASRDADGVFYYSGRRGERIRVKGENVSAYDIEQCAMLHGDVQKAAAIGVPSRQGEEDEVVLFIEPAEDLRPDLKSVMEFLRGSLAKHMHPHEIRVIETMPVTQTNKIQKHKLLSLIDSALPRRVR